MKIRSHHLKYAAARTFPLTAVAVLALALLALLKGNADVFGLVLAGGMLTAGTAVAFLYFLWRSQRTLPMTQTPRSRPKRGLRELPKPEE